MCISCKILRAMIILHTQFVINLIICVDATLTSLLWIQSMVILKEFNFADSTCFSIIKICWIKSTDAMVLCDVKVCLIGKIKAHIIYKLALLIGKYFWCIMVVNELLIDPFIDNTSLSYLWEGNSCIFFQFLQNIISPVLLFILSRPFLLSQKYLMLWLLISFFFREFRLCICT